MSLTNDARLVIEAFGPEHERSQVEDAAVRLATAYIEAGKVEGGGCQFCGAPEASEVSMECGTWWDVFDGWVRSEQCRDSQIARMTARLATVSAELADHKRRLMEQSAVLNAVRQARDELKRAYDDCLGLERKGCE